MKGYRFDEASGVWLRPDGAAGFGYSDGDEVEERLLRTVQQAQDVATGSAELSRAIVDWPTQYHFSPRRPDALRPLGGLLGGRVLEVGAGCGAITRWLGELGAQVTALEGSPRRAAVAAARCRGLDGVRVVADTLADADLEPVHDAVTLIGVLEYSRVYGSGDDPVRATLERCRDLLAPGGVLVIAIENQLGLKYFAGAPEDHLGVPWRGIQDQYASDGPVTFGRQELDALLAEAGFASRELLVPLPDYKLARSVLTERGLAHDSGAVADVLRASGAGFQGSPYQRVFAEELVWPALLRNGLVADLANSFVLVAAREPDRSFTAEGDLLTVYASDRLRSYAKLSRIVADEAGVRVERAALHPGATDAVPGWRTVLEDEPVLEGQPLVQPLQDLLQEPGWDVAAVARWGDAWVQSLRDRADETGLLPPQDVDRVPGNLVRTAEGLVAFDQEWVADEPVPLAFVVLRGLLGALASVRSVAPPAPGTPLLLQSLAREVAGHLGVRAVEAVDALHRETAFQAAVTGRDEQSYAAHARELALNVREPDLLLALTEGRQRTAELQAELAAAQSAAEQASEVSRQALEATRQELATARQHARHELDILRGSTSWRLSAPLRALGPLRTRLQGPASARRSLRDPRVLRSVARSVRTRGVVGTVRRLQEELTPSPAAQQYQEWVARFDTLTETDLQACRDWVQELPAPPLVSVLMPVYDPSERDLRRALDSVLAQVYEGWELCAVDDCSTQPHVARVLQEYAARDARIQALRTPRNSGIAGATQLALDSAQGEFVAFLDHDDELRPHALALVVGHLAAHPEADLVYSDEDKIDAQGARSEPYFKPDYNPELLLAQNYVNHLTVARTALVRQVGGLRAGFEGAQDHDLVLRLVDGSRPGGVQHVPHVLYHWRQYAGARSFSRDQLDRAAASSRRAITEALQRRGERAEVVPHPRVPFWNQVRWSCPEPLPGVTVVIPTRDRLELLEPCLRGLLEGTDYPALQVVVVDNDSTDPATLTYLQDVDADPRVRVRRAPGPFNYSRLNNEAVREADTELVLLLNNDVVVREPGWLRAMVALVTRPGVGAVGARLLYGDGTVQHAGVVLGVGGVAGHALKHAGGDDTGYLGRLVLTQQVSAATAACLLVRREVYEQVGGLDEVDLTVAFNDVDLCLKVREAGHRLIWCAEAELFHLESVSRGAETTPAKVARFNAEIAHMQRTWGALLQHDPAYNPNLTDLHEDYRLAAPPRVRWPWKD